MTRRKKPTGDELKKRLEALESDAQALKAASSGDDPKYEPGEELTPREAAFVQEYVACGVGIRAVMKAGFTTKKNSAHVYAYRLLQRPRVINAIAQARAELFRQTKLTGEFVIEGLKREALTAETAAARVKAFELLGKHRQMFVDVHAIEDISGLTPEQRRLRLLALVNEGMKRTEG